MSTPNQVSFHTHTEFQPRILVVSLRRSWPQEHLCDWELVLVEIKRVSLQFKWHNIQEPSSHLLWTWGLIGFVCVGVCCSRTIRRLQTQTRKQTKIKLAHQICRGTRATMHNHPPSAAMTKSETSEHGKDGIKFNWFNSQHVLTSGKDKYRIFYGWWYSSNRWTNPNQQSGTINILFDLDQSGN